MPASANYDLVFDLAQAGYRQWWFPAFGLIFVFVGSLLVFAPQPMQRLLPYGFQGKARRVFGWRFLSFALLWSVVSFLSTYGLYLSLKHAEESGRFRVVEGKVQNFHPMPYGGHAMESFEVGGVQFSYSDYVVTAGFNNTASHGGPIRQGLPVRVSYVGNSIVKLEIRSDRIPSPTERSDYTTIQKSEWRHSQETDPVTNHMMLGFKLAIVLITVLWNIDWRHYMRYWKRSGPPYGRNWELGFRAFFALSLAGSVWQLGGELADAPRSLRDYGAAALDGLLVLGLFLVADAFFRWRRRRTKTNTTSSV